MDLLSNSWLFRAEAMRLDWHEVLTRQVETLRRTHSEFTAKMMPTDEDFARAERRSRDVHLWWACSGRLGVPRGPFTVWAGRPDEKLEKTKFVFETSSGDDDGASLASWGGIEAAIVEASWTPDDTNRPSRLSLYRAGGTKRDLVAAVSVAAGSGSPTTVLVRCSGATSARVENGSLASIRVRSLVDVVNDPGWRRVELVGLPCEQPWTATEYDASEQGFVDDLMAPRDAAVARLLRGAPPFGWGALTQSGRIAPIWEPADPDALVNDVQLELLPEIGALYQSGVREFTQRFLEERRAVDGPTQQTATGSRSSQLATAATIRPFSLLTLPAQTDPLLNLATGFGTTYGNDTRLPVDGWPDVRERLDFMVTADYKRLPPPRRGGGTFAAYAPQTGPHLLTAPATGLTADRSGLNGPIAPDEPWRESIRVSWDAVPATAALGRVTAGVLARYDAGDPRAECLAPLRAAGGHEPLALSPDGPEGGPGHDRIAFVDAAADIPIGSGGRHVGYATALVDIHGLWSTWRDVDWNGDEPATQVPRIISLALDSTYDGNPAACPGGLRLEAAVDWSERTPTGLEFVAWYYPMALASDDPPVGIGPGVLQQNAPAGCFRRDFALTFSGDTPVPSGCTVTPLAADGESSATPGHDQGDGGRRYALEAAVPLLDWSGTRRWGVQVWTRSQLRVGASPTAWTPDVPHPARAVAANPTPIVPLPPPAPPGVPLGSTVDAQGCSHVRVQWSLPTGADVRTSIVWEVSETALRRHAGLSPAAPESDSPGVRLAALWAAYDAMPEKNRRAAFRRLDEVDGSITKHDVALPKGSTDIHLFTVTTQTMTGIESPWPGSGAPNAHEHLQAAIGPKLRQPAAPLVRSVVNDAGSVTLRLYSASRIPVTRFLVHATRSADAARDRESMGPAVASASATQTGSDPVMGSPMFEGTWTGSLPPSWDPWFVRAVAEPVNTIAVEGVRGVLSAASDMATVLTLPTGAPDLDALTADLWGADHRGVVIRTSTSAPPRPTENGSHRLGGSVGSAAGDAVAPVAFEMVPETPLASPPAGAGTAPVLERGARSAGRSPVALWFTRPVAADPVDVTVRLTDPLGRSTERTLTVPGWVAPPSFTVSVTSMVARTGGVVATVETDASAAAAAGNVLHVAVSQRRLFGGLVTPDVLRPGGGPQGGPGLGRLDRPPVLRPPITRPPVVLPPVVRPPITLPLRVVASADFPLADIATGLPFFPDDGQIHAVRVKGGVGVRRYALWLPATAPLTLDVSVTSPEGQSASARASL